MESQLSEVGGLAVRESGVLLAVPEAELQLEASPVIFQDIKCRLALVSDDKADHPLEGLGPGLQSIQLPFVDFVFRTSGGVKPREVHGAVVQLGTSSPPSRFFRRGIEQDCIVPEPADDMESAVTHRRDECAL